MWVSYKSGWAAWCKYEHRLAKYWYSASEVHATLQKHLKALAWVLWSSFCTMEHSDFLQLGIWTHSLKRNEDVFDCVSRSTTACSRKYPSFLCAPDSSEDDCSSTDSLRVIPEVVRSSIITSTSCSLKFMIYSKRSKLVTNPSIVTMFFAPQT